MSDKKFLFYVFLSSGLLLFVINAQLIVYFITLNVLPGWDGSSHQAIGELYSKNIFPNVWGWVTQWYLGMPFPQFYPPAFYFLVALTSHLLFFIPYDPVFRGFVLMTLFIVPGTIAWCGLRLSQNREVALLSVFLCTIFLSFYRHELAYGVNVLSTINTGLFPNALGFLFFVAWIRYFFNDRSVRTPHILSVLWLSLTFLTDVHLVFPAFILFCVRFSFDLADSLARKDHKNSLQISLGYALYGLLAIGLSSFWLLPMFAHYDYFSSVVMPISKNDWLHILITFFYLPSLLAGGLYIGIVQKQRPVAALAAGILTLYAIVAIGSSVFSLGGSLPFHFIRWFCPILYLSPIILACFLVALASHRTFKWLFVILFSMLTFISFKQMDVPYNYKLPGIYFDADIECIDQLIKYMQGITRGLVLVEADYSDNKPRQFAVDARLGLHSVRTVFSNIRESAMSGLYLVPVRNLFSKDLESWGVTSFLSRERSFIDKTSLNKKLDISRYFGVRYIIASSQGTIRSLTASKNVRLLDRIGPFAIFDIGPTAPANDIKEIKYAPIALFAELGLHHRKLNDLTFSRFSEEWLRNFDPNIVYVMPKTLSIEDNPVFDFAGSVVLITYNYKDLGRAVAQIERFSAKGNLIILDHKDGLCNVLRIKHIKNIIFMHIPDADHPFPSVYISLQKALKNDLTATSHLLLIKRSYFPEWKARDGARIYLASPSFMMAVSNRDQIKLTFTTPLSVYIGYALSIVSLLMVLVLIII